MSVHNGCAQSWNFRQTEFVCQSDACVLAHVWWCLLQNLGALSVHDSSCYALHLCRINTTNSRNSWSQWPWSSSEYYWNGGLIKGGLGLCGQAALAHALWKNLAHPVYALHGIHPNSTNWVRSSMWMVPLCCTKVECLGTYKSASQCTVVSSTCYVVSVKNASGAAVLCRL